jgi:hypothetical protein
MALEAPPVGDSAAPAHSRWAALKRDAGEERFRAKLKASSVVEWCKTGTLTFDPITAFPPPIAARIGLPEHRMDTRAALLHLARDADDRAFAVGDGGSVEHLTNFGMRRSPSIAPDSNSGLESSTK